MTVSTLLPSNVYRPVGAGKTLMECRDREVMLAGPADTGKSRAALEKLHLAACNHPGMRSLICRKTRKACTEAALVTFEHKVIIDSRAVHTDNMQREQRHSYKYVNGSEIVVGGLDEITKILS